MSERDVPPIGERIRAVRTNRGVTVRGLAAEVGVSASLISQIENGRSQPSVSTLYAITTALKAPLEDLFAPTEEVSDAAPGQSGASSAHEGAASRHGGAVLATDGAASGRNDVAAGHSGAVRHGGAVRQGGAAAGHEPAGVSGGGMSESDEAAGGPDGAVGVASAERTPSTQGSQGTPGVQSAPGTPGGLGGFDAAAHGAAGTITGGASAGLAHVLRSGQHRRIGPVVRPGDRERLTLDTGVVWELLGQVPDVQAEFMLVTYQPGGTSSSSGTLMRHTGIEYGFLISGELILTLGFEEHHLQAGDAISFDSTKPHGYRNEGTEPAVGLWLVLERLP